VKGCFVNRCQGQWGSLSVAGLPSHGAEAVVKSPLVVVQGATPLSVRQYMARLDLENKSQNPNKYIYFHLFSDVVCNVGWKLKTPLACFW